MSEVSISLAPPGSVPYIMGVEQDDAMTDAMTSALQLEWGRGYAGKLGNRCWVAEITGTDPRHNLRRTFLDPERVIRERFNQARTIIEFTFTLHVDRLYEVCERGERWFCACYSGRDDNGTPRTKQISEERATAWAAALEAGQSPRDARVATRGL